MPQNEQNKNEHISKFNTFSSYREDTVALSP